MADKDYQSASRALIDFVKRFTELQERHLIQIRETMHETVEGVMQGIQEISTKTEAKKKEANTVLVSTYTNPDAEAKATMEAVQDEVSALFEKVQAGDIEAVSSKNSDSNDPDSEALRDKLRRSAGLFSKHMEALDTLDTELQGLLLTMMGLLSRDDVIAQRIEHICGSLNAMQASLSYLLIDFQARCKAGEVEKFCNDMQAYIFKTYTMEEEKNVFKEIFPDFRKAS
jgi:hypothetical protein